jgi:hypothetical protein
MIRPFRKDADNNTLYGALFGLSFPLFATILRGATCDGACNLSKFISLQIADPLLWIIDSAPVFLGLFARVGGIRKDRVTFYAKNLEALVEDDGAGINTNSVREKAVSSGMITQEQAVALTSEEAFELIVKPGFSTAQSVTDISGRGVGMDAVATSVTSLGGTLDIQSEPGNGAVFIITIPERKKRNNDFSIDFSGDAVFSLHVKTVSCNSRYTADNHSPTQRKHLPEININFRIHTYPPNNYFYFSL